MKVTLIFKDQQRVFNTEQGWRFVFGNKTLLIKSESMFNRSRMVLIGLVSHEVDEFTIDTKTEEIVSRCDLGTYEDIKYDLK